MIILILLVMWGLYKLASRVHARLQHADGGQPVRDRPRTAPIPESEPTDTSWTALDDHQLTRLLAQAGPHPAADDHDDVQNR